MASFIDLQTTVLQDKRCLVKTLSTYRHSDTLKDDLNLFSAGAPPRGSRSPAGGAHDAPQTSYSAGRWGGPGYHLSISLPSTPTAYRLDALAPRLILRFPFLWSPKILKLYRPYAKYYVRAAMPGPCTPWPGPG